MATTSHNMNVKSAIPVFEVLEFFDEIQRDASLGEIARRLGYPVSSTSMLLQSRVDAGYLVQGEKRVYRPTPRGTPGSVRPHPASGFGRLFMSQMSDDDVDELVGGPSHLIRDNASSFSKLLRDAVLTSCVPQPRAAKRCAATAGLA